jgi:PEGA domain
MKSPLRNLALVTALVFVSASAFAQFQPKKIWDLTVVVNAPNAIILVDNVLAPGGTTKVAGGPHNVKVHADGYYDFNGPVVVTGHQTFNVQLQPAGFPVTIRVNVPNAVVIVDGVDVTGTVPGLSAGTHSLQVRADGYRDYHSTLNVTHAMVIDVALQPGGLLLSINANAANSTVAINNIVKGPAPYSEYLAPGTYTVRVSAPGFVDYLASVVVDRPVNLNVQLQPIPQPVNQPSILSIAIPPALADPDMRQGDPQGQVKVFIDNRLVNRGRDIDRIVILPGRHRIRIASGAFSVQLGELMVQPGMNYVIEVGMDLKVRAMKAGQQ